MLTEWRLIESFPDYSVSDEGFVRNDDSGRRMAMSVNQSGVVHVGLTRNHIQYKRAVSLLVARAFVKDDRNEAFNSTINLDGDRFNNRAANLVWRPRWFATKYFQQFEEAYFDDPYPIEDMLTRERFHNPWDAAKKHGLIQVEILLSICNGTPVWPTNQRFRRADE
jgi:hypothetical protein